MSIITGNTETLSRSLFSQVQQFQTQAPLKFGDPDLCQDPVEQLNQQGIYVISQDQHACINAYARIATTSQNYLLATLLGTFLQGQPLPASDEVWELSHFAALDFNQRSSAAATLVPSEVSLALLKEVLEIAAQHGVQRLITIAPIAFERLMRRANLHSHRAGPPQIIDGHPVFACWIEIS